MQLPEISRMIENLIRIGTIVDVDHANHACRVQTGNLTTEWLQWVSTRAGNTKVWNPPSVGEQCLVFSPSGETANGVVLTGIYSDNSQPPSSDATAYTTKFPDGAMFTYDHNQGHLHVSGVKKITAQADDEIFFDCPLVKFNGEIKIGNINFGQHNHTGDDGGPTSAPIGNVS